jgi:hypothetical protein
MNRNACPEERAAVRPGRLRRRFVAGGLSLLAAVVLLMTDRSAAHGQQVVMFENVAADVEGFRGADDQDDGDAISLVVPQSGELMESAESVAQP